jgi:hypothetical protein
LPEEGNADQKKEEVVVEMKKDYKTRENNEELDGSLSSTIVV